MIDAISQFQEAMSAAGLEPPEVVEAGKLYRFPGIGKRNGNTAGWCLLFDDGLGAVSATGLRNRRNLAGEPTQVLFTSQSCCICPSRGSSENASRVGT